MASLTIMKALFGIAANGGVSGAANLLTNDPREAATISTGGNFGYVDIDYGVPTEIDTVFAGFRQGDDTAIDVAASVGFGGASTYIDVLATPPATAKRRHHFKKLAAPVTSRYFRFSGVGIDKLGIVAVGKSVQPVYGHEWGAGRVVDDRSAKEPLASGGWGIYRNAVVPGWQFTVGDLTDAELAALWNMVADVGGSCPVLVCEDPDPFNGMPTYSPVLPTSNTSVGAPNAQGMVLVTKTGGTNLLWDAGAHGTLVLSGDFVVHAHQVTGSAMVGINSNASLNSDYPMTLAMAMGDVRAVYQGEGQVQFISGASTLDGWLWRRSGTIFAGVGNTLAEAMASPAYSISNNAPQFLDSSLSTTAAQVQIGAWRNDFNERLHYGLFDRPEAFERLIPGASRWAFRVQEWL